MQFCWVTINVKDMEESLSFYRDILGLPVNRRMQPMPGTEIAFLGTGTTEVELIRNDKNSDCEFGKDISMGFIVESLAKTVDFLKTKGLAVHSGPFQPNPSIKFLYVLDPNGLRIQLIERLKA